MKIKSCTQNDFVNAFLTKYAECINDINVNEETYYIGTEEKEAFRYSMINDDVPFGKCDNRIAMNASMCEAYRLDEDEMTAMLFHEIGHIVYPNEVDGFEKEHRADGLAISVGLGEALKSGLQKLVDTGMFREEKEEMIRRINAI
ncbi:MAG: hypothetical protein IJ544_01825 [Prevotella sp.]|nr:hypothetical protein [Prevotella sp.]